MCTQQQVWLLYRVKGHTAHLHPVDSKLVIGDVRLVEYQYEGKLRLVQDAAGLWKSEDCNQSRAEDRFALLLRCPSGAKLQPQTRDIMCHTFILTTPKTLILR